VFKEAAGTLGGAMSSSARAERTGAVKEHGHVRRFGLMGWLMAGYLICLPIQFRSPFGLRVAPSDLFLLLTLLLGFARLKVIRPTVSVWHYALLAVFAVATFVAVLRNGHVTSYAVLQKDLGMLVLFAGYLVLVQQASSWERIRSMLRIFIFGVTVQNAFGIFVYFSGLHLSFVNDYSSRLSGMLIDPNAYGGLLCVTFAVHALTYYRDRPLVPGLLGLFTTFSLAVGILLTFSRSAWIGMVMVLLVVILLRVTVAIRIFAMLGVAVGSVVLYKGAAYIATIQQMATRTSPIEARLDFINTGLGLFAHSPWFGVGLGTFDETYNAIIHNTLVWVLTEFGLIGFGVLLGFILWFVQKGWQAHRLARPEHKPLILGLLLAHAAMLGLSLGIEALYQRHWWFVLAMLAASFTAAKGEETTTT
jgi:putative inorganic carbon (hco3(-)) transporter